MTVRFGLKFDFHNRVDLEGPNYSNLNILEN